MDTKYKEFLGNKPITVTYKDLFSDAEGFPNDYAFRSFVGELVESDNYYLACISIDLSHCNATRGYAYGTLMLRKVFLRLADHFYAFRVSGDKFNLILPKADIGLAREFLDAEDERYTIYYGIVEDKPITGGNCQELRRIGIDLMYQDKATKTNQSQEEINKDVNIIGNLGNTPPELQETATHKYLQTMWYSKIYLSITEPNLREATLYVFPTEYKENQASLETIVVVDDYINPRVYKSNNVTFGLEGIRFTITARFDVSGDLNIGCFKDPDSKGEYTPTIEIHKGVCIPATFGKRVGNGREIYPTKPNVYGASDYVLYDRDTGTISYETSGIIQMDGNNYTVQSDNTGIDLILLE